MKLSLSLPNSPRGKQAVFITALFALILAGAQCTPVKKPSAESTQDAPQGTADVGVNANGQAGVSSEPQDSGAGQAPARKITVAMQAQNNSGMSGTMTLTELPEGKVYVEIAMEGVPAVVARPAHIHKGFCPKPGEVVHPLTNIVDGRSESTLSTTLADLASQMPLAVNVHKSFAEMNIYVACGDFPAEEMRAMKGVSAGVETEASSAVTVSNTPGDKGKITGASAGVAVRAEAETPWSGSRYLDYSIANLAATKGQKQVLFFHASWCPFCKEANADFTENAATIPAGVVVLKVDYDTEKELKAKYGVTSQHTFVQIDAEGNAVTTWSGGGVQKLSGSVK